MAGKEFTLDFSGKSGIPSQWGIDIDFVANLFGKQTKNVDGLTYFVKNKTSINRDS